MTYATVTDVQARMKRRMTNDEESVCVALLEDAGVLIDAYAKSAADEAKAVVSCRMVVRAMGNDADGVPMGATQGSMSGLGYSQSWTMGSGASVGELYLSKTDKTILGAGNTIGSYSPVEGLVANEGHYCNLI